MTNQLKVWLFGMALIAICGGCGSDMPQYTAAEVGQEVSGEQDVVEKEPVTEEKKAVFGSVPYFKDDTGKDAQLVDGYLYGYWNGRLCRYDVNNNYAEQVLFDAGCSQAGRFCISEGVIYFLTRPTTSTLTNENTCLYKINCDGSGLVLLQDKIADPINVWNNYEIEIYEDIIYLIAGEYSNQETLCYRLLSEEQVESISLKQTLYGEIPEGFEEARTGDLPSIMYMMRNYGYVFLEKVEGGALYAYDFGTKEMEKLCFGDVNIDSYDLFLTHEAVYFREYNTKTFAKQWYRLSLDDLQNPQKWIVYDDHGFYDKFFYDASGVYFVKWDYYYDDWLIYYAGWKDETGTLVTKNCKSEGRYEASSVYYGGGDLWYFDGEAFYYNEDGDCCDKERSGQDCIIRNDLEGNKQIISVYNEMPDYGKNLCYFKKEEVIYSLPDGVAAELEEVLFGFYGDGSLRFTMEKAYLRGDTQAVHKINEYLQAEYEEIAQEWIYYAKLWESLMTENMELVDLAETDWVDLTGTEMEASAGISYADEKYIVFHISDGGYWSGAVHPNYYSTSYVFDRNTGERLSITDIIEKSEEEIYETIVPYLEKDYDHFDWYEEEDRETVLDPDRLFLTKEGIGIFFNTYEIDCYAAGIIEFVIPYEAFE